MDVKEAASLARNLIDSELLLQNKMWGDTNDRADISKGQLLHAAQAQTELVNSTAYERMGDESALEFAKSRHYPKDWSGFRNYGSNVANLVVAAAYLQNEIKRRLMNDETSYRAPRRADQPYDPATGVPKAAG
jgi:hypothetical protein